MNGKVFARMAVSAVFILAVIVPTVIMVSQPPKLSIRSTILEEEGVGLVQALNLNGEATWFQRNEGVGNGMSVVGLQQGQYYIHIATGPWTGWGINPQGGKVNLYPMGGGWYRISVVSEPEGRTPYIAFFKTR